MVDLVTTPGSASANSYLTVEEADAYFESRLHADAWDYGPDDDVKAKALIWATRLIDANVEFTGHAATEVQRLSWPRSGMTDRNGNPVPEDVIPDDLKAATAELAMLLFGSDRTLESDVAVQGLTKLRAGPVEFGFRTDMEASRNPVPDNVLALMPWWWLQKSLETVPAIITVV